MNNRVLSLIIIGLCALSLIIGIISSTISACKKPEKYLNNSSQGFAAFFNRQNAVDKIALITLEGEITSDVSDGFIGDVYSAESVKRALKKAATDNYVKGVLLRINSPGGTVGMSQEIYSQIIQLRKKKPVVVSMADLAASGGYYISSAADRIYAEPGTLTGSIGVIMSAIDAHDLLTNKLGIKSEIIKSGKFKDMASPYRPLTQEEKALLQNLINSTYHQFLGAIIEGRVKRNDKYTIKKSPLTVPILKAYADGRVFTGEQAQKLGFIDQLGGQYEAQKALNKMIHTKFHFTTELPAVPYNVPVGIGETLFGVSKSLFFHKDEMERYMPLSSKYPHQALFVWE